MWTFINGTVGKLAFKRAAQRNCLSVKRIINAFATDGVIFKHIIQAWRSTASSRSRSVLPPCSEHDSRKHPPVVLVCHTHPSPSSHPARSGCLHQWTPPPSQSRPPWTVETSAPGFLEESETAGLKRKSEDELIWGDKVLPDGRQKRADWQKQRVRNEQKWLQPGWVVERLSGWRGSDSTRPHLEWEGEKSPQNTLCCTESESSRSQSALVPGTGVLVGSDGHQLQDPFGTGAVHPTGSEVNQDQVVVRSTWFERKGGGVDFCFCLVKDKVSRVTGN